MKDERYDYLFIQLSRGKHLNTISVMKREPNIILEKSEAFSNRIVKMYQYLRNQKKEQIMSKQVLRSGTSIGANVVESKNAQSTADYLSKQNIALKEADETQYWYHGGYLNEKEFLSIYSDCTEIVKMLVASIKTIKKKMGKL